MKQVAISMNDKSHAETSHFCGEANTAQDVIKFRDIRLTKNAQKAFFTRELNALTACKKAFLLKPEYGLNKDDLIIIVVDANLGRRRRGR